MINNIKIEICSGSIEDAIKASKYPIDRIEFNKCLEYGGLTPSLDDFIKLKQQISIPIMCMIRDRKGNFSYSDEEYNLMYKEAIKFLEAGADGIVFGFVNNELINIKRTKAFVELIHSYNKEAIFHKAFDETKDLEESLKLLINLKVDRVLTGGGKTPDKIIEGSKIIGSLNDKYHSQIELLPGGGVKKGNIKNILDYSKTKQIHLTSKIINNRMIRFDEKQFEEIINIIKRND